MDNETRKSSYVLVTLAVIFTGLAAAYVFGQKPYAGPVASAQKSPAKPHATPATVRISAGQMLRGDGDKSGFDCYACHDEKKAVELKFDANQRLVLPKEHADLIFSMRNCVSCHGPTTTLKVEYAADGTLNMPAAHQDLLIISHGRNNRNDNCFNCHDPAKLNQLVTRDGTKLKFEEATRLCASCHGPTYRDWEAGVHGRTSGHWNREMGPISREECTSCHDPHAPAFPQLIPLAGPRPLHPAPVTAEKSKTH